VRTETDAAPPPPGMQETSGGRSRVLFSVAAVTVLLLFGAYVFYSIQFSGVAQWAFGVALLGLLILIATYSVMRRTRRPEPFVAPAQKQVIHEGELTVLADTLERADRGLGFSRELLVGRMRDAIAERVRLVRGLSPDAMRDLETDPPAFRQAVGDAMLSDFLLATRDRRGRNTWVGATPQAGFLDSLEALMDRTEGWR